MIILDTNIISELMRSEPYPPLMTWITSYSLSDFALTSITIAEIYRGIMRLPEGKKRNDLVSRFEKFIAEGFLGRIYSFDALAAEQFGYLCAKREMLGLHIDMVNMMIAAIAVMHQCAVATRNEHDFTHIGVELINPWKSS